MQISTNSWHFRFMNKHTRWKRIPTNLCPYMRSLLWLLIKRTVALSFRGLFYALCAFILISPWLLLVHNFIVEFIPASWLVYTAKDVTLFLMLVGMGVVCYVLTGIVLAVGGAMVGVERYKNSDFARNRRQKKDASLVLPPKEPSVVAAWWKDFHDKTCTPLEFVNAPE